MTEFDPKKEKKYKRTLDLIRAKYEFYEADVSEDDWIFEKDSIEDIIRASIEILDKKIQKVLSEQDNLFGGMSYGLPDESSKTFINKEIKELKKEKKALEESLKKYLEEGSKNPKFCDFILKKKNDLNIVNPADIYKPVLMTRKTYHNVITIYDYKPSFETCVQFIFSLKLNIEESTEMLRLAGLAFSESEYHRIVKFYVENKEYNFDDLNKSLLDNNIKPIGNCK